MKTNLAVAVTLLLATQISACESDSTLSPQLAELDEAASLESDMAFHRSGADGSFAAVKALTWNIYVGTNVDAVLGAPSPEQIPVLAAEAFRVLLSTNFPERADAIAKQIAKTRPHVVGLQEISLLRIQSPGDAVGGGMSLAETVFMDFLAILMAALEARGLHYYVAGSVENTDVEVPMLASLAPLSFDDIRLTDYDVVLARRDVETSEVDARNYNTALVIPHLGLAVKRGYVAVTARVRDLEYRFVNTHLEPASSGPAIQLGQAQELVAALNGESRPVILAGDLNTRAPNDATYNFLLDAGFQDVWTIKSNTDGGNAEGYTSNHDDDLRNEVVDLHERIDYIMVRNSSGRTRARAYVVGDALEDRTASGLWPSDHAGVFAGLSFVSHEQALIEQGIEQVASDVAALGEPAATKLGPVLERALAQVRAGRFDRAVERLRNFKGRVRLLVRKGTLSDAQGQSFVDAVQVLIRELRRLSR